MTEQQNTLEGNIHCAIDFFFFLYGIKFQFKLISARRPDFIISILIVLISMAF